MYSAEVLSQVRSLNWLTQEICRVPPGSRERALLQSQVAEVRARLPDSMLAHHDRLAKEGKLSAAQIMGDACGGCHSPLPPALLAELATPGRFGVCPKCGVFSWAEESLGPKSQHEGARPAAKVSHAQ